MCNLSTKTNSCVKLFNKMSEIPLENLSTTNDPTEIIAIDSNTSKFKTMALIASMVTTSTISHACLGLVLLTFVGKTDNRQATATAGLFNFYVAVTALAFCMGWLSAQDTLTAQALGSGNMRKLGLTLLRSCLTLSGVFCLIAALWFLTERVLLALQQEKEIALAVGKLTLLYLPFLPFYLLSEVLKRWCYLTGSSFQVMCITVTSNILSVIIGYLLIYVAKLGLTGFPLSLGSTSLIQTVVLVAFVFHSEMVKEVIQSNSEGQSLWKELFCLSDLLEYIKLAVPGAAITISEWLGFEIHSFMAGWLGIAALGAQGILINTAYMMFSIPLGLSIATSILVGVDVGQDDVQAAKEDAKLGLKTASVVSVIIVIMYLLLHSLWGRLFTTSEEVVKLVATCMFVLASLTVSDFVGTVAGGVYKGLGKQAVSCYSYVISYYVVGVPLGYLLAFKCGLGLTGLWLGVAAGSWINCGVLLTGLFKVSSILE